MAIVTLNSNEILLRKYESEVLDIYHKSFLFWNLPRNQALYAVMAAYDSMLLPISVAGDAATAPGSRQYFKSIEDGFVQALRWIFSDTTNLEPISISSQEIIESALEFLIYCSNYAKIAYFHTMYSKGLVIVTADQANKTIKFDIPENKKGREQWSSFAGRSEALNCLSKKLESKSRTVHQNAGSTTSNLKYGLRNGRIELDDITQLSNPQLIKLAELNALYEDLLLDDNADLVGFSLGQFRVFWNAIMRWSLCVQKIYVDLILQSVPQQECMPTQIINQNKFCNAIEELTKLTPQVINAIVQRLIYDQRNPKSDIFLQPLIMGEENISWCPFVIQNSQYGRNMLKLMARTKSLKSEADNLIGSREILLLRKLGLILAKRGKFAFKLNRKINHVDEIGELDLLAYNQRFCDQILLIEGKALLAADEVNEISAATEILIEAQNQLLRNLKILKKMPLEQKITLYPFVDWHKVNRYFLVIITPETQPNSNYDGYEIPVTTLEEIKLFFKAKDCRSPFSFWEACRNKNWLRHLELDEESHDDILVGGVIYKIPVQTTKDRPQS